MNGKDMFDTRFGVVPKVLIETEAYQEFEFKDSTVTFVRGFRGSGKTVLMGYFEQHLPDNWIGLDVSNSDMLIRDLSSQLYRMLKVYNIVDDFVRYLDSIEVPSIFKVGLRQSTIDFNDIEVLKYLLDYFSKTYHVMIFIDEASPRQALINFLLSYSSLQRVGKQVSVTITGIDSDIENLKKVSGLTYLIRAREVRLGLLDRGSMADRYQKIFGISSNDSFLLANLCGGFAYGFQLMGELVSENIGRVTDVDFSMKSLVKKILVNFKNLLFSNMYSPMFMDLKRNEQLVLIVLNKALRKNWNLVKIADILNMKRQNLYGYLRHLMKLGVVRKFAVGRYGFNLMYFDDFIDNILNPSSGAFINDPGLIIDGINDDVLP